MWRSILTLVALVVLVAFAYLALTVPLGQKTLWQHVRAIAGSAASQDLYEGVKDKAKQISGSEREGERGKSAASGDQKDTLTPEEQRELRRLIRERMSQRAAKPPTAATRAPAPEY